MNELYGQRKHVMKSFYIAQANKADKQFKPKQIDIVLYLSSL